MIQGLPLSNYKKDESFKKREEIPYNHVVRFVLTNTRPVRSAMATYYSSAIIYLLLLIFLGTRAFSSAQISVLHFAMIISGGVFAGSILVIPFHEGLHGIAYFFTGARNIHFGSDLSQMIFYVSANKYVLGRRGFYLLALTPFIVINLAVLILIVFLDLHWQIGGISFLFSHNLMCLGDFAMANYFQNNRKKELYTFDDQENRVSYIYEKTL